jgi:hypothetical protein
MNAVALRGLRCATAPQGDGYERASSLRNGFAVIAGGASGASLEGWRGRGHLNFPLAATGSVPMISSPRTITTSSIMLTTTQT